MKEFIKTNIETIGQFLNRLWECGRACGFFEQNRCEYGKFMAFKFGHEMTREELRGLSMAELVGLAKRVMGANETFFGELIAKERSENKLCKVARWLEKTAAADVHRLIERNRARRPESSDVCLGARSLRQDFHLV